MENSTALDKTTNSSSFSLEDISDKYSTLKCQYENVCKLYDASQQELHDIRRNHLSVIDLKDHLTSEMEALQNKENKLLCEWTQKYKTLQDELDHLKQEKWSQQESFSNTINILENQIVQLEQCKQQNIEDKTITTFDSTKIIEEIRQYEEETVSLKTANMELKKSLAEVICVNEVHTEELESLREQVECLKSNLLVKKEELAATTDMLHSAQEDMYVATMELQQLKSQNPIAAKGNSLFAEVDDKRQEMLKSLSQMKEKVYQLNRELISKQAEVDSLLCEKKTLWEEYAGHSNHHDAVLIKAYERRITDLVKEMDQLNREKARWFDKHIDPNSSEVAQWLSGVMEHYRKENQRLTEDLAAASVNNLSAEQKLRELQRQIVTWRTKALESRAVASDLETKLQLAERTMQNITAINTADVEGDSSKPAPDTITAQLNQIKEESNISLREGFREINVKMAKKATPNPANESFKVKEILKSGILSTSGAENKVMKKTTFK